MHYDNLDGAMIIEDYKERNSTDATMIPISTIVEDYYNGHLCSGIQPTIFEIYPIQSGDLFQISYTPGRLSDLLKFLRDLEYRIYGSETFEYSLLENDVKAIYQKDKQVATIYIIFPVQPLPSLASGCLAFHCLTSDSAIGKSASVRLMVHN